KEKPKPKYRNPKIETNLNDQKAQIPNKLVLGFDICLPLSVAVCFGFRFSDFGFKISTPEVKYAISPQSYRHRPRGVPCQGSHAVKEVLHRFPRYGYRS